MTITTISGSYSQPIIASLTPWQKSRLAFPTERRDWPPYLDADRLVRYEEYLALIETRHQDVLDALKLTAGQKDRISLAIGLPELLCNVWADSVWSDAPEIELPTDAEQNAWDLIDTANDWTEIGAWESVFAAAAFGHSILRLRRDEDRKDRFGTDVVIEEIDAGIYFPKLKPGSSRALDYVVLAWEEDRAEPGAERLDVWQVRETHTVENGQYRIVTQERRPRSSILGGETDFRTVREEEPEGVDFLPFVELHAKRWRGRYWGVSELSRCMTLFDEIDGTLSNIAEILDYHGKPMLQVPASWIYGGVLTKGSDKVMGVRRPEDKDTARYITYDGQIDAALAELDKVIELVLLTSEVPRTYFGLGEQAATTSGTSLKLQLQNYVKKAGRWQRAETRRTRELVEAALRLDGIRQDASKPAQVTHGSPLPVDDEQEARIETSLYTAKLSSRKTSITKLRMVEDVDEEIAEIEDEEEAAKPDLPTPIIPGTPTNGVVRPNAPEPPAG